MVLVWYITLWVLCVWAKKDSFEYGNKGLVVRTQFKLCYAIHLFLTRVIIQLQCFCAPYVVHASLCLNFCSLSCTWLLVWVHVTGRNTDLTTIYTHFHGRGQYKAPLIMLELINIKVLPCMEIKLSICTSLSISEAKCLKTMLMNRGQG